MPSPLYQLVLSFAAHRSAVWAMAVVAFAESSFFPVPPDLLLAPMIIAAPKRAWFYAFVCTLASVLGGIVAYGIGVFLYDTIGIWIIEMYHYTHKMEEIRSYYDRFGAVIILLKGLTPIPFKLITLTSGLLRYNFPLFVGLCIITRGARFLILAALLRYFEGSLNAFFERHFTLFLLLCGVLVIGGGWAAAYLL